MRSTQSWRMSPVLGGAVSLQAMFAEQLLPPAPPVPDAPPVPPAARPPVPPVPPRPPLLAPPLPAADMPAAGCPPEPPVPPVPPAPAPAAPDMPLAPLPVPAASPPPPAADAPSESPGHACSRKTHISAQRKCLRFTINKYRAPKPAGQATAARGAPDLATSVRRCAITPAMRSASRPTPWIIPDDIECRKCWPTK